jgi:hypothetical protein
LAAAIFLFFSSSKLFFLKVPLNIYLSVAGIDALSSFASLSKAPFPPFFSLAFPQLDLSLTFVFARFLLLFPAPPLYK